MQFIYQEMKKYPAICSQNFQRSRRVRKIKAAFLINHDRENNKRPELNKELRIDQPDI